MPIKVNLDLLESAAAFPYLGYTIAYNNINYSSLYHNLVKERRHWGMVLKVMEKTGGAIRARVIMYKVVLHTVIFYRSESWVVI